MTANKIKIFCAAMLLVSICNTCYSQQPDSLVLERIKYLQELKNFTARNTWKEFENSKVAQIYFSDSSSYLFNASPTVLEKISVSKIHPIKGSEIVKTKRIDDNPFHMETSVEAADSTVLYFKEPIVMFNDFENTKAVVSDLQSLQQWASMVVHELFHGYQLQHPSTFKYGNETIYLRGKQLQWLYTEQKWFAQSVKQENDLLLDLLEEKSKKEFQKKVLEYIALRESRQKKAEDILTDFGIHEDFYEKIEGSAKYIELALLENFSNSPKNTFLLQRDTAYIKDAYQNFELKEEPWMYSTESVDYFYSTGYNLLRVLDKLKISYKKEFFNTNITAYQLLKIKYKKQINENRN